MASIGKIIAFLWKWWPVIKPVINAIREVLKGNATVEEAKECIGDACRIIQEKKAQKPSGGLLGRIFKRRRR